MRGLPSSLPLGGIAFLSTSLGALASARRQSQQGADGVTSDGSAAADPMRACSEASNTAPHTSPETRHIRLSRAGLSFCWMLSPQLLPLTCLADASGYDAMEPAAPPASASFLVPTDKGNGTDGSDDGDTITGVFHRLDPQRAKLLLVQVVFRHGARTTLSSRSDLWRGQEWDVCGQAYQAAAMRLFSTAGVEDPVSKHDLRQRSVVLDGGCRKGELTLLGQSQALELGRWLRGRYVEVVAPQGEQPEGFLPPAYQPGAVEARTTNISRTVATLRGVLTGLYPDLPKQGEGQEGQEGQGVPRVTTSGDFDEILYADTRACPHLGSFQAISREAGRAAVRADPDYSWARGELIRLLGMDPSAFDSDRWIFTDVHDVLTSLAAHGKALPPGFAELPRLRAAVNRLATKEFGAEVSPSVRDSHGRTVLRLSMGRLLHILVGNMGRAAAAGETGEVAAAAEAGEATGQVAAAAQAAAAAGTGKAAAGPRLYLYSGHDSTVMPLLSALGVDVTEWPPYLSNLVFELWQLPSGKIHGSSHGSNPPRPRYVVRVLYNQQELPLPHCPPGFQPSLHTFEREVVGPFLLSAQRHQELCRVGVEHEGSMPQPKARPKATAAADLAGSKTAGATAAA